MARTAAQYASWFSEASLRPLPRREHSVRDDYNILEGEHRITISPTGWIHEQHNRKVNRHKNLDTYVAQEIGFTRYERITDPDLSAAEESWQKVGPYWAAVRATWKTSLRLTTVFRSNRITKDQASGNSTSVTRQKLDKPRPTMKPNGHRERVTQSPGF